MADNYLEYAREDYEKRKAAWLKKKRKTPSNSLVRGRNERPSLTSLKGRILKASPIHEVEKPEDEAL